MSSSSVAKICSRTGCGMEFTVGESYHNRVHHQETLTLKHPGNESVVILRNKDTKEFSCPLCSTYSNNDPEQIRVCFFLFYFILPSSNDFFSVH
ncbi:MAG: hypothetical protein QOH50_5016 [Kribbellaceae bacterium]|nr:hypothetical protein [Kribbellaceae bacterium]